MHNDDKDLLQKVAGRVKDANNAKMRAVERQKKEKNQQDGLFQKAIEELKTIEEKLYEKIKVSSNDISRSEHKLTFGDGEMEFLWPLKFIPSLTTATINRNYPANDRDKKLGYETIAGTCIYLTCHSQNCSHSATLLYLKKEDEKAFRWYQVAVAQSAIARPNQRLSSPIYLELINFDIYQAISTGHHVIEVVCGPDPIDGDEYGSFEQQWISWLAKAAVGELSLR